MLSLIVPATEQKSKNCRNPTGQALIFDSHIATYLNYEFDSLEIVLKNFRFSIPWLAN